MSDEERGEQGGVSIRETHPLDPTEMGELIAEIDAENTSAIVHDPVSGYWWGFVYGAFLDIWDRKWPALSGVRDATKTYGLCPDCGTVYEGGHVECPECGDTIPF